MASVKEIDAGVAAVTPKINEWIEILVPALFRNSIRQAVDSPMGRGYVFDAVRRALEAADRVRT